MWGTCGILTSAGEQSGWRDAMLTLKWVAITSRIIVNMQEMSLNEGVQIMTADLGSGTIGQFGQPDI